MQPPNNWYQSEKILVAYGGGRCDAAEAASEGGAKPLEGGGLHARWRSSAV